MTIEQFETKWEKYKPRYHRVEERCTDNCEKDCNMECNICRASPWDTKYYWILEGINENVQLCEKCFQKYVIEYPKKEPIK